MNKADTFDVIVIGSGAGGAAAADRLVKAGLRVLLCEKGPHLPTDGSTLDVERVMRKGEFLAQEKWRDGHGREFVPEEHFNVGGKTRWYGAALFRFPTAEFGADDAHGCRAWPLTYHELEPFYREAEARLGVKFLDCEPALQRIIQRISSGNLGWTAKPMPMGLAPHIAQHPIEASHFDGFASSAGLKFDADLVYVRPLMRDPKFTLLTNAEVTELLPMANDRTRITGVRLKNGRQFHASHILLAAGALHSPRLLQRYLHVQQLESRLKISHHIGRNLKLHLLTALVAIGPLRQADLVRKTMVLSHPDLPHSSIQPLGFDGEALANLMPAMVPRSIARQLGARAYGFFLQTEDGSHRDNRVMEMTGATTPVPVMDYSEHRCPAAVSEHRKLTRRFQRTLLRCGMIAPSKRIPLSGTAHACGTLVCGLNESDSVVDRRGKVHGMQGLYVVDGSVLPRSSSVNPSLTIYAWSLSVASAIAAGLNESDAQNTMGLAS